MSNLQDFLNKNLIKDMVIEVCVSDRFVDENGEPIMFKVKAITGTKVAELQRRATRVYKKGKNEIREENDAKFQNLVAIEGTIDPNFKDAKSLEENGFNSPEEYLEAALTVTEIGTLAKAILGLNEEDKIIELRDEVKN